MLRNIVLVQYGTISIKLALTVDVGGTNDTPHLSDILPSHSVVGSHKRN